MDILDNIKKQLQDSEKKGNQHMGQEVPDGYFDSLEDRLISMIPEKKKRNRTIPMWSFGAVAAAVCLVILAVFTLNTEEINTPQPLALSEVSAEESVQFLLSVNDNLDNEDLLEMENIDEILDEMQEELLNHTN